MSCDLYTCDLIAWYNPGLPGLALNRYEKEQVVFWGMARESPKKTTCSFSYRFRAIPGLPGGGVVPGNQVATLHLFASDSDVLSYASLLQSRVVAIAILRFGRLGPGARNGCLRLALQEIGLVYFRVVLGSRVLSWSG